MGLQIIITLAITILQWRLAGITLALIFAIIARLLFIARFQGLKVTQNAIFVVEGLGLGLYLMVLTVLKSFELMKIIVTLLGSAMFVLQVLIEINTKVTVSMTLDEYNALLELYKEEE